MVNAASDDRDPTVEAEISGIDWRDRDLRGRDFSRESLQNSDFSGADLRGCNFYNADLSGAMALNPHPPNLLRILRTCHLPWSIGVNLRMEPFNHRKSLT